MVWIISCCIAVLAGMGVGGGGLLVIYLTFFTDMTPHTAQGLNLAFFICAALASLPFHLKRLKGRVLPVILLINGGIFGSLLGCRFAGNTAPPVLRLSFGIFLTVAGGLSLFGRRKKQ